MLFACKKLNGHNRNLYFSLAPALNLPQDVAFSVGHDFDSVRYLVMQVSRHCFSRFIYLFKRALLVNLLFLTNHCFLFLFLELIISVFPVLL